MTLLRCLHTWIPDWNSFSPAILDLFLSSKASICSTIAFPLLENSDDAILSVSIDFLSDSDGMLPCFIAWLLTILMLIRMVFMIIREMFFWRISLNLVLVLLVVNFVSLFRLGLMYISIIKNNRSNVTHHHGFWLLVLLS